MKPYSVVLDCHIHTRDVTLHYIKNEYCTFFETCNGKTFHTELQRNKTNLFAQYCATSWFCFFVNVIQSHGKCTIQNKLCMLQHTKDLKYLFFTVSPCILIH